MADQMDDRRLSSSSFLALMNRLKSTQRWSGMHAQQSEDVAQHTFTTAIIAHLLCVIDKEVFGASPSIERVVLGALYHDGTEAILTDVIAPVKKYNREIEETFGKLEELARGQMIESLPDNLRNSIAPAFSPEKEDLRYIKAADKLDALCRATLEVHRGNQEFVVAFRQISRQVGNLGKEMPCVAHFVEVFLPAYSQSVDEYWYLK